MPVVFRHHGLRFYCYSKEGNPLEPIHVHIKGSGREAKIWLEPVVKVARTYGFSSGELKRLLDIVDSRYAEIEEAWNAHFSD